MAHNKGNQELDVAAIVHDEVRGSLWLMKQDEVGNSHEVQWDEGEEMWCISP